ncbi:MAG: AAA family ATPase, partial [Acidobacteria bacterium]|nr:AAA family ATPase [Acidobacteriota bacterium]
MMLGAPGSGKGTQALHLAESLQVPAISTGEMLREAVAAGSELGARVEGVMAAGALVADDLMGEVVASRLERDDARAGFILDGYPRTTGQAETLDGILARAGVK